MEHKRRVPLSPDLSAEVLYAADNTCCVCNDPSRGVQIHHIDEDPSNNSFSNLATLCLECHNKTQVRGGFTKSLSPALVSKYRAAWLVTVRERRTQLVSPKTTSRARRNQPRMTQEQARLTAQNLRSDYGEFVLGLEQLLSVAEKLLPPFSPGETFDMLLQQTEPITSQALKRIAGAYRMVRVEPSASKVSAEFDRFMTQYRQYMDSVKAYAQMGSGFGPSLALAATKALQLPQLKEALARIREAVRQHIYALDKLT